MSQVSVLMPVYNTEKQIAKSLESLINQSYAKDMEIIIVNDGSTDNSEKIIKEFMRKKSKRRYKVL